MARIAARSGWVWPGQRDGLVVAFKGLPQLVGGPRLVPGPRGQRRAQVGQAHRPVDRARRRGGGPLPHDRRVEVSALAAPAEPAQQSRTERAQHLCTVTADRRVRSRSRDLLGVGQHGNRLPEVVGVAGELEPGMQQDAEDPQAPRAKPALGIGQGGGDGVLEVVAGPVAAEAVVQRGGQVSAGAVTIRGRRRSPGR